MEDLSYPFSIPLSRDSSLICELSLTIYSIVEHKVVVATVRLSGIGRTCPGLSAYICLSPLLSEGAASIVLVFLNSFVVSTALRVLVVFFVILILLMKFFVQAFLQFLSLPFQLVA